MIIIVSGICQLYFGIKMKKLATDARLLSLEDSEDLTEKKMERMKESLEKAKRKIVPAILVDIIFKISAVLLIVAAILH